MKNIILIAPPASGKGTQSAMISKHYNLPHISAGDLLREAAKKDDFIRTELAKGHLIEPTLTISLIKQRILKEDCKAGYILDGFPRTVEQAKLYDSLLEELKISYGKIIVLEVTKEEALRRTLDRQMCPSCNKIYNKTFIKQKPIVDGICDKCKVILIQREDDNAISFEKRYKTFQDETLPLIEYYRRNHDLHFITSIDSDLTFGQVREILESDYDYSKKTR
jgi:adenylate kinase